MNLEDIKAVYETEALSDVNRKLAQGYKIIKIHCGEKSKSMAVIEGESRKKLWMVPYTRYVLEKPKD